MRDMQDMIGAMEAERRHLGEQIHDSLCQTLTSVSLLVERLRMAAQSGKPASLDSIELLRQQVETAIREARQLSRRFAPVELHGASLLDALQELAGQFPGVEFVCDKAVLVKDPPLALCLYRIAEEALDGAGAHGCRLTLSSAAGRIELAIDPVPRVNAPLYLALIEMRAECMGGSAIIHREDSGRAILRCTMPLPPA